MWEGRKKRQFIDTKAFTVINQIYLQFIQMFDLQLKTKKKIQKNHIPKRQNLETSLSKIPLPYTRQKAGGIQGLKHNPTYSSYEHDVYEVIKKNKTKRPQ